MIYGIGTDLVDLDRIRKMKSLSAFANKILGAQELEEYAELVNGSKTFFLGKQFAYGGLNLPCKTILNVFSSGTYASTCHVKSRFKTKIASNAMDSPFPFLFEMFLFSL